MSDKRTVSLTVNGRALSADAAPRLLLSDFLRDSLGLTGTHVGCEHGVCGVCTVLVDGEAVRSCLMFAVQAEGVDLTTVEGLADGDTPHPLQRLFSEHRAVQCGFCTPGMLMMAIDLVAGNPSPSEARIREGMAAVLCRCTGYDGIVRAVAAYAAELRGAAPADE